MQLHAHDILKRMLAVVILLCAAAIPATAADVIKILAIGNSFSEDAVEQNLHEICSSQGVGVVIANLFIPACTIDMHYQNLRTNAPAYSYRKIGLDGKKVTTEKVRLETALRDEDWDYITFQQASKDSGIFSTLSALGDFMHRVRMITGKHPVFAWHSTWAYAPTSTHTGFDAYGRNELQMYHDIVHTAELVMLKFPELQILIPTGTAIQNARTAILAGKDLTRDGYHLELTIGRYIAACTWYLALIQRPFNDGVFVPKTVVPATAALGRRAAEAAVQNPFEITPFSPD